MRDTVTRAGLAVRNTVMRSRIYMCRDFGGERYCLQVRDLW